MTEKTSTNTKCGVPFTKALLHPRFWTTWLGLFLAAIVAQLPVSFRHALGKKIGTYIYNNNLKRRNNVDSNLKIAFPELDKSKRKSLTISNLQWYACGLIDFSLVLFTSNNRLSKLLVIDGREHIDTAINNNRSIIILLSHSVMLDFAPAIIGRHYHSFGSYKTQKNAVIDWMMAKGRCKHVSFVISRDEGLRKLVKSLKTKSLMFFLPDEDLGEKNAVFAPFFSQQKSTLTTTARLAKMGKSIALPTFSWYDIKTKKYRIQILPPLENYPSGDAVKDATTLNESLEALIKEHPEQYMWTMQWYKTRPNGEPTLY